MVIVNSGTAAKSSSSPSTLTTTSVDEARTMPSGREAVTVIVCSPSPSPTSVSSSDNCTLVSSSRMTKEAGATVKPAAVPTRVKVLSSLAVWLSVTGRFKVAEAR